eukprot:5729235-Pyramimonas_sp.AAC.1
MFAGLARDRCDWLVSAPGATTGLHVRVQCLLGMLLLGVASWGCGCCYVFQHAGLSEKMLLLFEVVVIGMDVLQTSLRCANRTLDTEDIPATQPIGP